VYQSGVILLPGFMAFGHRHFAAPSSIKRADVIKKAARRTSDQNSPATFCGLGDFHPARAKMRKNK
jgi:hypothetical protein